MVRSPFKYSVVCFDEIVMYIALWWLHLHNLPTFIVVFNFKNTNNKLKVNRVNQ